MDLDASLAEGDAGIVDPRTIDVGGDLTGVASGADTDMDGVADLLEGTGDANLNGIPAHLDPAEGSAAIVTDDGGGAVAPEPNENPGDDKNCGSLREEAQLEPAPVDVVWAIDNSLSMADDFLNVSAGIADFTDSVASSGADLHIAMLSLFVATLDTSVTNDTEHYLLRPVNVQSTDSFRQLLNDYDQGYSAFLRPDAPTHFIVVTDDTSDMAAEDFRTQMEAKLGHEFYFHAIAPDPNATLGLGLGLFGDAYYDLATTTGGETLPITSADWSTIFSRLETAVVQTAEIPCEFELPDSKGADLDNVQVVYTPEGGSADQFPKATMLDQCGEAEGWAYDSPDDPTTILLCPAACEAVKAGGNIEIVFACEPPVIL